jgi:hypothetical protein
LEVVVLGADAEQLLAWVGTNIPDAHITVRVTKSVVQDHFVATGECPEGTSISAQKDKFHMRRIGRKNSHNPNRLRQHALSPVTHDRLGLMQRRSGFAPDRRDRIDQTSTSSVESCGRRRR